MSATACIPVVFGWYLVPGEGAESFVIYNNLVKEHNLLVRFEGRGENETVLFNVVDAYNYNRGSRIINRSWGFEVYKLIPTASLDWKAIMDILTDRLARIAAGLMVHSRKECSSVSLSVIYEKAFCCDFKAWGRFFVRYIQRN